MKAGADGKHQKNKGKKCMCHYKETCRLPQRSLGCPPSPGVQQNTA